ncbi:TPR domain-containing protein [Colletotrichum chrysophilum]|uniref:TPR domain-containing protein n=1 Tax=Colletotrichum chrysophilum TaxID=1836956 RepID=A0AAD8ZZD2_9PEZI|nr:TPR domain-containing protein [Colletotrichum chrysophilum]
MATDGLYEPQVFNKTHRESFNKDTPKHPYLAFKLGTGQLQRLVIKIWSNDQGWCDNHLRTQDPYANSHTWFSLGLVEESTPAQASPSELLEFQRNVRASSVMRCHTNQWTLGVPAEEDDSDVHAWLESLSHAEGSVIGVYPLARYSGWVNTVWKMEVLVYTKARYQSPSPGPHIRLAYEEDINANGVRVINLDDTIHIMSSTIQLVSEDRSTQAAILDDLGNRLGDRYSCTGAMADLEEAILIAIQAVEATPEDHPDQAGLLNNLGNILGDRYSRTGAMADLEEAIHIARQAVEATPEDHPDRATRLNNLGVRLGDRYSRTRAMADLEEAIHIARQAVQVTPEDHPNRATQLNNLGVRLGDRYFRTGAMADLEEAIHIARQAVQATPEDHPDQAGLLNNLGNILGDRYSRTGAVADLKEAIRTARQAIEATPEDHPDRAGWLNNLGNILGDRYSRTGAMADLEEAIHIARQAVQATPEDHPDRATQLNNLGVRLGDRYSRTGAMADLEEAIHIARKAVQATPEDHPDQAGLLNNLGNRLGDRYSRTGAVADLEEAIHIARQAVQVTPEDHPNWAGLLNNLGGRLGDRYSRTGAVADLKEAILIAIQAVEATPEDHPDRATQLNTLGNRLGDRYSRTGAMADLEEAIHIARQAVEATPEDHPDRATRLNNLGVRLGDRYSRTRAMADLEEAIRITRQAVQATPEDHPDRAGWLNNLGGRLGNRYSRTGAMADLEDSRISYTTALYFTGATTSTRVSAGRSLLSQPTVLLAGLDAYHTAQTAVKLVSLSAPFSLQSADKQHLLSRAVGLASDAAAVALHVGQGPLPAIELLETGRGVIASSLQDIRTDLSSLEKEHPNLAKSFVDLRNLLDAPVSTGSVETTSPVTSPSASPSAIADQRHQASSRMTALLSKIRQQPGFETFLIAATEVQMREAAAQGPIVIINVSRHRCDALIIEQAGVQVLQLHQLTREDILSKAGQSKSLETLSWLWTVVAKPVLDALGFTKTPADDEPWSHVWWIPTGPLVRFPLHAAGYHLQGNSETVLDRVVSSYSSSIKSIINTRQQKPKTVTDQTRRIVLVAMGETPGNSVLQYAVNEVDAVRDICILNGVPHHQPEAYQKEVLDALDTCHIFHFAGHGGTDSTDPLQSRLLLKDWQETPMSVGSLLDKTNLRSTSPFLAYLSACGTGQILDDKSVDESIHLTSAFQLAGFRHVIGTLWEVDDALCVVMARMTYEFMSEEQFSDGSVAYGLHHAMRTLRDQWVSKVECSGVKQKRDAVLITDTVQGTPTWVPYVHYGV